MTILASLLLDSGAFLPASENGTYVDVGYFESAGTSDVTILVDGKQVLPTPTLKLGTGNHRIDVQHMEPGGTPKAGITKSRDFDTHLLLKRTLYGGHGVPDFDESQFDCIIRLHSGILDTIDVHSQGFNECDAASGTATGKNKTIDSIARDVIVYYALDNGEWLQLTRHNGSVIWSSKGVKVSKHLDITIDADPTLADKFYRKCLTGLGSRCWMPNPNPPPVGSP